MKTKHKNLHHLAIANFNHRRHKNYSAIAKNNHKYYRTYSGFTIAELSLATVFISILLVTIAILIVHLTSTFQKGLSIKSVNTMGQTLSDNFSRTIAASKGEYFRKNDDGTPENKFFHQWQSSDSINIKNTSCRSQNTSDKVPTHGEFCTSNYTYIWNTGYVLDENQNIYKTNSGDNLLGNRAMVKDTSADKTYSNFRLLRISGAHCATTDSEKKQYEVDSTPLELLPASESALAIYDLQIFSAAYDDQTQHAYVSGSFILGTVNGGIDVTTNTNFCTDIPDGLSTDFNYCAINKFSFGTRTGIGKRSTSDP